MFKRYSKYLNRDGIASSIIIPILSLTIGIAMANFIDMTLLESIFLTLLTYISGTLFVHTINSQVSVQMLIENDSKVESSIGDLKVLADIQDSIYRINHPYFKAWAYKKLEQFIDDNYEFFQGTNRTHPHAEDTFGIPGINGTLKFGTLRALSVIDDYWDDPFTNDYIKAQADLISTKNVRIQRIFVVNPDNLEKINKLMSYQHSLGIEVYYIEKDNQFINNNWLKEDYIIQDDRLLVEITCESQKFNSDETETELITVSPVLVNKKKDRFLRIMERAVRFSPKQKSNNSAAV